MNSLDRFIKAFYPKLVEFEGRRYRKGSTGWYAYGGTLNFIEIIDEELIKELEKLFALEKL